MLKFFFESCKKALFYDIILNNCYFDIYGDDDFINILRGINDEITNYLYKTGNYKVDIENSINRVESNPEFEILSDETAKKLIKKVHREYMDGKMSSSISE